MLSEKNPSIYDDRGAIGSSEELDEYGVWVKSGPQDISKEFPAEDFSADDPFDDADAGVSLDLSEDFSFSAQDDLPDFTNFTGAEDTPAYDGDPGFGEFSFEGPENDDSGISFETIENEGVGTEELSDSQSENQSVDIDIPPETESDETMDFDSFSEPGTGARDSADAETPAGEISFAEINSGKNEDLNFEDFTDGFPEEITGEAGFSESANSLELDEDFTISFDAGTGFPEESPGDDEPAKAFPAGTAPDTGESGVSTQILLQIVKELSSIKTELSDLKRELISVKGEAPREEGGAQSPGGFFDESDDEKIALTGAEMDNILHTASFTEETGSDAVDGAAVGEPEVQAEPQPETIEIDMDEFGSEPAITPENEELPEEDIPGLSGDLLAGLETELSPEPSIVDQSIADHFIENLSEDSPALASTGESPIEEITGEKITAPNFDSDELLSDALAPDLLDDSGANISDLTGELSVDTDILSRDIELPLDDGVSPDGETGDLDLDANLSPDLPPENGEEAAGVFDSSIDDIVNDIADDNDIARNNSFAQLIPEGFEDKSAELPLHVEDVLEEDEFLDTGIPGEDETVISENLGTELLDTEIVDTEPLDTEILDAEILDAEIVDTEPLDTEIVDTEILDAELLDTEIVDEAISEDISVAAGTGDIIGPDSGFGLASELDEDARAIDGETPEISLDLGAEFDADVLAAAEDIKIDIPADTETAESAGEEPVEFDFTEEPFESPDEAAIDETAIEDTELLLDDISLGEPDVVAEEVLPDIALEDNPAVELPVEDVSLSTDFDEFSVETPEETPGAEIPAESEEESPASPPSPTETGISQGGTLANVPVKIREELKTVLTYMDQLLESLPEEKIEEFAKSEYFDTYKKLFEDLGLV
jgi:hypothetical protein